MRHSSSAEQLTNDPTEGIAMDFIERIFNVSPDGGDGSLEALCLLAAAVAVGTAVFRRRISAAIARLRHGRDQAVR
jgi:hypothetical protein